MMYHTRRGQRPVAKERLAVDVLLGHETPDSRIAGVVPIIAHDEVVILLNVRGRHRAVRQVQAGVEVRLRDLAAVYSNNAFDDLDAVARKPDYSLDVTLRWIVRKPENYDVAAIDLRRPAIVVVVN